MSRRWSGSLQGTSLELQGPEKDFYEEIDISDDLLRTGISYSRRQGQVKVTVVVGQCCRRPRKRKRHCARRELPASAISGTKDLQGNGER